MLRFHCRVLPYFSMSQYHKPTENVQAMSVMAA